MSYAALIERLEKAKGPRLELDGMVWCAINGYEYVQWDGAGCAYRDPTVKWDSGIRHVDCRRVLPYSASLDAAVALVERVLPGWTWGVHSHPGYFEAGVSSAHIEALSRHPRAKGQTPAIALLIATLKALEGGRLDE